MNSNPNNNQPSSNPPQKSNSVPQKQQVSFSFNAPQPLPLQQPVQQSYNGFVPQQINSSSIPSFQFQQNVINAPQQISSSNFSFPQYNQQQQYIPQQQYISQQPYAPQQKKASQPSFFPQQQQQQSYSNAFGTFVLI